MKLLTISVIMSCNRRCGYCPVRKWLRPASFGGNRITNRALLAWLDAYINPNEWIIEITGGEPGLYPEIGALVPELDKRGYRGLIKTNGSLPLPKSKGFQLIAAWHGAIEEPPELYDQIAIIKNPDGQWAEKEQYCAAGNIPYRLVEFEEKGKLLDAGLRPLNKITACLHVNSAGQITKCAGDPPDAERNIFDMAEPAARDALVYECPKCKIVNDVEKFLPPDLSGRIEADFNALLCAQPERQEEAWTLR